VGVAIDCLISVDGRVEDRQLVEEVVAELEAAGDDSHWRVSVFLLERNRGVGLCRNRAFQEVTAPFFSCLDADDIFHPLRCLHALLALQSSGVDRLKEALGNKVVKRSLRSDLFLMNVLGAD
jgi:glycosyltransferase involved in cell wall biosynthesis